MLAAACTMVAVFGLLIAEHRGSRLGVWICKPLASLGFIAVAVSFGAAASAYGRCLQLGLGLCALGDVCLIPRANGKAFLIGIGSFALAHAVYAWAFFGRGVALGVSVVAGVVMLGVVFVTLRWLRGHLPADMQVPVRVYMAVIALMVALALGASVATGDPCIGAGAAAFAASDLSVARERFVRPSFINLHWGLPLYYIAQLLLAWTAAS
jgi:uncharacterized membrane protein YhhN